VTGHYIPEDNVVQSTLVYSEKDEIKVNYSVVIGTDEFNTSSIIQIGGHTVSTENEYCKNFFYTPGFEKEDDQEWKMAFGKGWHQFP
jgi:hypothetical protein